MDGLIRMVIIGGFCPGDCWELEILMRSYSLLIFMALIDCMARQILASSEGRGDRHIVASQLE